MGVERKLHLFGGRIERATNLHKGNRILVERRYRPYDFRSRDLKPFEAATETDRIELTSDETYRWRYERRVDGILGVESKDVTYGTHEHNAAENFPEIRSMRTLLNAAIFFLTRSWVTYEYKAPVTGSENQVIPG